MGVNQAGFTLHSAIYAARPDVKCIVHIHTPAGAAVSTLFSFWSVFHFPPHMQMHKYVGLLLIIVLLPL